MKILLKHHRRWQHLAVGAVLVAVATSPAMAQTSDEDWARAMQFVNEVSDAINSVNKGKVREAHASCVALGKRLEGMETTSSTQRLSFEAEIDYCIFYSMHHGKFSDDTGDQCSYHHAYASKLSRVIAEGRGQPGFTPELMDNLGRRLESAMSMGPAVACTSDYSAFEQVVAMAREEAAKPEPEFEFSLWNDISALSGGIKAENARERQEACLALAPRIDAVPDRPLSEKRFYEGLISDCVARAMAIGEYADDSGDVCVHHFRFASSYAEGVAAAVTLPPHAGFLAEYMREELRTAKRQGPDMGCKQDYAALKEE